ncbi:GNAT family N-acetyltransferase [Streptomyces olivochromogenes]|uniref:GNAT family N-acetyltransferase n=1 Tax=Streptomyces olivochromogenes TaxID=1963 RepID=UPI001F25812C|nr:GNAT family protein [Streptomyces olivochromogenes]MCF3134047.1 GNAT family N-acetyltransferase [Streptomyces olivochromogenes]
MDKKIRLIPVSEKDLGLLDILFNASPESDEAFDWFGFSDPMAKRRRWSENGLLTADSGTLTVVSGQEALGTVSWRPVPYGPLNRGWNIGIGLRHEVRGQGIGTQAQALLARYLFAHTEVNRVDAHTNVKNIAEQRALEKAGFTREGVLRGAQFRNGRYHDMVVYGILRSEVTLD